MATFSRIDTPVARWMRLQTMKPFTDQQKAAKPADWYNMLELYYNNNGLYQALMMFFYQEGQHHEAMWPLRNPANRAVEFHVNRLWPGSLPDALQLEGPNAEKLQEPIEQLWVWSNWAVKKQLAARWLALFGDMYIRVATRASSKAQQTGQLEGRERAYDQVFMQLVKPQHVTVIEEDERGYIEYARLDIPQVERLSDGEVEAVTYTEVWSKANNSYRLWMHDKEAGIDLERLGEPDEELSLTENLGIDFVPLVHGQFRDVGDERGAGCFDHALDKIDEANRQATRLHQMLFRHNDNTWVAEANQIDQMGRPMPPPKIGTQQDESRSSRRGSTDENYVVVGDTKVYSLPGQATLKSLVPDLKYDAALDILKSQLEEVEQDLPELAYYRLREHGDLSGRALRIMLGDAIDRVAEARGNVEPVLCRAHAMALTIAAAGKLEGFTDIGSYENGAFEHTIAEREVIPVTAQERAELIKAYKDAGYPLIAAAQKAGANDEEIELIRAAQKEQIELQRETFAVTRPQVERNQGSNGQPWPTSPTNVNNRNQRQPASSRSNQDER